MRGATLSMEKIIQGIICALAFSLPFQIFSLPLLERVSFEPANILGCLLLLIATSQLLLQGGRLRFNAAEKAVLLCVGIAFLSLLVGQAVYGWRPQLVKGVKQLAGLTYVVLIFLTVRRYCATPEAFIRVLTWYWRGLLVLGLFGLWQSLAFNVFHIKFLADWSWAKRLNPNIGGWRFPGYLGPVLRSNSFAAEPAHYCQFLFLPLGFAITRLLPPTFLRGSTWRAFLPSRMAALVILAAFLLSFSLVGLFGLMVMLVCYNFLYRLISWKAIMVSLLISVAALLGLNHLTRGVLAGKAATMAMLLPGQAEEVTQESVSAVVLVVHMQIALLSLQKEPLLGWGIGGHGTAYDYFAPTWLVDNPSFPLADLSRDDACSLGLLLLSEMGLIGFAVFCLAFSLILWRAWRAVKAAKAYPGTWRILPLCIGLLVAAIAGAVLYVARFGSYYYLNFYLALALTSVIPEVLWQAEALSKNQRRAHA